MSVSFRGHQNNVFVVDPVTERAFTYQEFSDFSEVWGATFGSEKTLVFLYSDNSLSALSCYFYLLNSDHVVHLGDAKINQDLKNVGVVTYCPDFIVFPNKDTLDLDDYEEVNSPFSDFKVYRFTGRKKELHGDLKMLLSTSGSTGTPRLVKLSKNAIYSNAVAIKNYLNIGPEDKAIMTLPMSYSYGLSIINSHIVAGASIILNNYSVTSRSFWDNIKKYRPSSFAGVPQMYKALLSLGMGRLPLQDVRYFTQAGGKLSSGDIEKVQSYCRGNEKKFFVMYGQTEATARISYVPPDMLEKKIGSIGIAIPGGVLELKKAEPQDVQGELVYRGANVMMGYAESEVDLSSGDQMKGVLETGDLGYADKDGYFYITGRLKRFIKMNGYRYSLDEIQTHLSNLNIDAVCTGRDDLLVIAGLLKDSHFLKTDLSLKYQIHQSNIITLELTEIPLNLNGKPSYDAIMRMIEGN